MIVDGIAIPRQNKKLLRLALQARQVQSWRITGIELDCDAAEMTPATITHVAFAKDLITLSITDVNLKGGTTLNYSSTDKDAFDHIKEIDASARQIN